MRYKLKPVPKLGDTRIVKKFLTLPRILNNELRWLEIAKMKQSYCDNRRSRSGRLCWKNVEFIAD